MRKVFRQQSTALDYWVCPYASHVQAIWTDIFREALVISISGATVGPLSIIVIRKKNMEENNSW